MDNLIGVKRTVKFATHSALGSRFPAVFSPHRHPSVLQWEHRYHSTRVSSCGPSLGSRSSEPGRWEASPRVRRGFGTAIGRPRYRPHFRLGRVECPLPAASEVIATSTSSTWRLRSTLARIKYTSRPRLSFRYANTTIMSNHTQTNPPSTRPSVGTRIK